MKLTLQNKFNLDSEVTCCAFLTEKMAVAVNKLGCLFFLNLQEKSIQKKEDLKEDAPYYQLEHDSERIFLGGKTGALLCLDFEGTLLWRREFDSTIAKIVLDDITQNGTPELLVSSYDFTLRVFDTTGEMIWAQSFSRGIEAILPYKPDQGPIKVIAGGNDGSVRIFNKATGEMEWFFMQEQMVRALTANQKKGLIYCGGDDYCVHMIDFATQKEIGNYSLDSYVRNIEYLNSLDALLVTTYSYGYLRLIGSSDAIPRILLLNADLSEIIWEIPKFNVESMEICDHYLVCGTTDGELVIVKLDNGEVLYSEKIGTFLNQVACDEQKGLLSILCADDDGNFSHFSSS